MPAETKKNHSADADRVKEVYKVTIAGSIINVVLLVLKFAAGILGHSAAMIADAIHSLTDFATDVVVLVFVKLGNKPKDKDHDYGHGKFENLSSAIEALLIVFAAVAIVYESIQKFNHIAEPEFLEYGILIMLISIIVNYFVSARLMVVAKKTHSQALEADGLHLRADIWTSVGVLVGLAWGLLAG